MVDEAHRTWGINIRLAREAAGFKSQAAFAEAVGVTQPTVWRWEHGISAPSDRHKVRIAGIVKQDVRVLFPLFADPEGK